MNYCNRIVYLLSLLFGLAPTMLNAQQLRQPASVLPWQSSQAPAAPTLGDGMAIYEVDSPAWLLEKPKQVKKRADLPMVEIKSSANLGTLKYESNRQRNNPSQRHRSGRQSANRPFSLLRALGIDSTRNGSRR